MITAQTIIRAPTPSTIAIPSHPLLSADKKSWTPKAVAGNVVKPSIRVLAENPWNCDVEGRRSMVDPKNES